MTLRRGDLSAYYPIIRSSPVFIVIVSVVFLGQTYAAPVLLGFVMVIVGAFFVQYRPGARLLDDPRTLTYALLGMSSTGIYTISDAFAMQVVEPPRVKTVSVTVPQKESSMNQKTFTQTCFRWL